ncbi:MAG: hypothetical protein ACK502_00175 [Alphaproteobacteria bacterium]
MTDSTSPYVGGYYVRNLRGLVEQYLRDDVASAIGGQTNKDIAAIVSERSAHATEHQNTGRWQLPEAEGNVDLIGVHSHNPERFAFLQDNFAKMGFRVFFPQASSDQLTDALPEFIEQSSSGQSRVNAQKIPNGQTDFRFFLQVAPDRLADVTKALLTASVFQAKTQVERAAYQLQGTDVKALLGGGSAANVALRELQMKLPDVSRLTP